VQIANPRDYVEVASASFTPARSTGPGSNLLAIDMRARGAIPPPPCSVELVLSPDRIPGLGAITKGTSKGVLPPLPKSLTLSAAGIQLAGNADPNGVVGINVDGYARAFLLNVTFARYGDPSTPSLNLQPQIRLDAPGYANSNNAYQVTIE